VHVQGRRQKNLVLILAREFASQLATPMFVTDAHGNLVFFNEPAEIVLGRTFAETGEIPVERLAELIRLEHPDGSPMELAEMPAGVALLDQHEAHASLRLTGLDGVTRSLAVTAFPLFAREELFLGVVMICWEQPKE
jgi:PAS domain-containing protein